METEKTGNESETDENVQDMFAIYQDNPINNLDCLQGSLQLFLV